MDLSPLHVVFAGAITLACVLLFRRFVDTRRAVLLSLLATLALGFAKEIADMTPGALHVDIGGNDFVLLGRAEFRDVWFNLAGMAAAVALVGWARLFRFAAAKIARP
jgi:hypothetical protein